ncbi:MAG: nucleotidyltransferase family protein [Candidatus Cybelea sp.]
MKAVVTAGGRIDGAFASAAGTRVKALASLHGATMLARVLGALRESGATRIAVVGGEEVRSACGAAVERFIDESPSGSENLLRALRAWPEDGEPLLYATSDLPYITADAIRDFTQRTPDGTLAVPLVESADYAARFPHAPACGITLAGERVVNGGIFLLPPDSAPRLARAASGFFEARKRPWRMASLVGPLALIRFAAGRLSVTDLERTAQRVLQMPASAVRRCAAELGFDVDTAAEYAYATAQR